MASLGRGLAYGTKNQRHFLNVRASNLSVLADEPAHFIRWLAVKGLVEDNDFDSEFVSRSQYEDYVDDVLRQVSAASDSGTSFQILHKSAVDITSGPAVHIDFDDNTTGEFDFAVLCIRKFLPSSTLGFPSSVIDSGRFIGNPWDEARLSKIQANDTVLIVGSGLTMVDDG